jgi:type IV pilus assembly protein PilQ
VAQDINNFILAMQLAALENEGKVNILSSPSITTLDNQVAVIESGKEVPYQTVEDNEVNIEFKKAVLSLKVTPHIIDGKTLKLEIETKKDELDFSTSSAVQGNPTITTKRAETSVILFNGETAVIGGLSKESSNENDQGVPFLKDIPLLGHLFKSRQTMENLEEVLIFITPHILQAKVRASTGDPPAGEKPLKPKDGVAP